MGAPSEKVRGSVVRAGASQHLKIEIPHCFENCRTEKLRSSQGPETLGCDDKKKSQGVVPLEVRAVSTDEGNGETGKGGKGKIAYRRVTAARRMLSSRQSTGRRNVPRKQAGSHERERPMEETGDAVQSKVQKT